MFLAQQQKQTGKNTTISRSLFNSNQIDKQCLNRDTSSKCNTRLEAGDQLQSKSDLTLDETISRVSNPKELQVCGYRSP